MLNKLPTAHILEKDFQLDVRDIAQEYGWHCFTTYNSQKSPPGEPDLRLIRPPRVVFAELKRDKGALTAKQEAMAFLLRECAGIEYYIWRPRDIDQVHQILGP